MHPANLLIDLEASPHKVDPQVPTPPVPGLNRASLILEPVHRCPGSLWAIRPRPFSLSTWRVSALACVHAVLPHVRRRALYSLGAHRALHSMSVVMGNVIVRANGWTDVRFGNGNRRQERGQAEPPLQPPLSPHPCIVTGRSRQ